MQFLVGFALLGAASFAVADIPKASASSNAATSETVVVLSTAEGGRNCNEATPETARSLADQASQDGAYQRAGQCYLIAGEHALANQAFVKASAAQVSGDTSRRLAANLSDVKTQARQMKLAFQHR